MKKKRNITEKDIFRYSSSRYDSANHLDITKRKIVVKPRLNICDMNPKRQVNRQHKGHKVFVIDGDFISALNYQNALRKHSRLHEHVDKQDKDEKDN